MAVGFSITVKGSAGIKKAIAKANRGHRTAIAAALMQKGNEIAHDAQQRTPRETGALRASEYVKPPRIGDSEVEIGYGQPYAAAVHERTELKHPVGTAKFLQRAINAASRGYVRDVGRKTARNVVSGTTISRVTREFPTRPKKISRR